MKRRVIASVVGIVLLVVIGYGIYLGVPRHDYFIERVGTIVHAEVIEERRTVDRGYTVRLQSSTGLSVDMRVLSPVASSGYRGGASWLPGCHRRTTGRGAAVRLTRSAGPG